MTHEDPEARDVSVALLTASARTHATQAPHAFSEDTAGPQPVLPGSQCPSAARSLVLTILVKHLEQAHLGL
jgi:hypothetical protein